MLQKLQEKLQKIGVHGDALLAAGVIGLILLLIVPLPPLLLDTLLCFNIVLSVMALLLTLYIEDALEFNAFPSLLLFLTLYRLGLNIASTRMILTRGEGGDIIQTFGEFVTEGNIIVGLIIFSLLTIINFIVVTKGAGRIAEVAARFTLEALPGKQMAIDSELSSGLMTQLEAKKERKKIASEAEFYGAMDGASKFVRGDAIAGIIITLVNIVGGFLIGVLVKGLEWQQCLSLFTRLTVGDGLVSQIPALLISIGAGIIVTRASSGSLGKTLPKQVLTHPKVLLLAGVTLLVLSIVPGMPFLVMAPIAFVILAYAYFLFREKKRSTNEVVRKDEKQENLSVSSQIVIALGVQLVSLAEAIHQKIPEMRQQIGSQLGIRVPSIQVCDDLELSPNAFAIKIKGVTEFNGRGVNLFAITEQIKMEIERHAHVLINRQDVAEMIENARKYDSAVVDELIPDKLSRGDILKVLQGLLKEGVPICDFVTILEILADNSIKGGRAEIELLIEKVRQGFSRGISEKFFGKSRVGHVITIDPKVEQMLDVMIQKNQTWNLRPSTIDKIERSLIEFSEKAVLNGLQPIVLTTTSSRSNLRRLIEQRLPKLPVLSYQEVSADVKLHSIGMISNEVLL